MVMSGLMGSKRSIYSLAPSQYVGPANKRLNLGNSSHVVTGQPYPYPIDTTRRNNLDGWTPYNNVTTNNGYGCVMPDRALIQGKSSIYLGVTRYPGHFEAFVWDNCATGGKPKTVYMGGYYREEDAARAYDLAALKIYGIQIPLNFPLSNYLDELEKMKHMTKAQYLASIKRMSRGFTRGSSCYRGVTRIPGSKKWQATLGKGKATRSLYLGTFDTEEDAAKAYDVAAIRFRGEAAITNFSVSDYNVDRRRDVEPVLGQNPSFPYELHQSNPSIDASRYSGGLKDVVIRGFVHGWNDRRRDAEPVLGQKPSFLNDLIHEYTPAIDASRYSGGLEDVVRGFVNGRNDRRCDAEPVLGQNPSFSYDLLHESTPDIDASRYSGGLEDIVRGFVYGGNDRRRWRIEELRKFLEIDSDEGCEHRVEENHDRRDTDKPLLHQNPRLRDVHQTGPSCLGSGITNPPLEYEFICRWIEELIKFLKNEVDEHPVDTDELLLLHQNPSHPNFHQIETSSLESGITTLPLDECNYCSGVEDLTKTPFDEIDGMNLVTGDEVIMTTEFGFLSDPSIDQVDWDELLSDGPLPSPSNNFIEIPEAELLEFGALDGWLNDYINGRVPLP